jgi:hypothetical protein
MDVCPRIYVLCCPVEVEALRLAHLSSKESYKRQTDLKTSASNS